MKSLIIILLILLGGVTVNAQKVTVSANPNEDLTRCKTYTWAEGTVLTNATIKQLIIDTVDLELSRKGLKKVENEAEADLVVVAWASTESDLQTTNQRWEPVLNTIARGIPAGTQTWAVTKGTLVIDLLDAKTQNGLWRGTATAVLEHGPTADPTHNAKTAEKPIKKAVTKMFKKFPSPK